MRRVGGERRTALAGTSLEARDSTFADSESQSSAGGEPSPPSPPHSTAGGEPDSRVAESSSAAELTAGARDDWANRQPCSRACSRRSRLETGAGREPATTSLPPRVPTTVTTSPPPRVGHSGRAGGHVTQGTRLDTSRVSVVGGGGTRLPAASQNRKSLSRAVRLKVDGHDDWANSQRRAPARVAVGSLAAVERTLVVAERARRGSKVGWTRLWARRAHQRRACQYSSRSRTRLETRDSPFERHNLTRGRPVSLH